MAKQVVSKTVWMNKFKARAKGGWKKASGAAPKVKGQQLPGGLINAVAQLIGFKADFDKNQNPYIMLQFVLMEPAEYAGIKGSIFHSISASKAYNGRPGKTVEEKLEELSSNLQLLGGETEGCDEEGLFDLVGELCKAKPFFLVNTVQFDGGRGAMAFIQGPAENFTPSDDAAGQIEVAGEGDAGEGDAGEGGDATDAGEGDATVEGEAESDGTEEWQGAEVDEHYMLKTGPKSTEEVIITKDYRKEEKVDVKTAKGNKAIKGVSYAKLQFVE